MYFIGVDHHKQTSFLTILGEEDDRELKTGRVENRREAISRFLKGYEPFAAVLEAGYCSYVMVDLLKELGGEVKIANPLYVKWMTRSKVKTDKRDSGTLARMLKKGEIVEVNQRPAENRRAQRILRLRAFRVTKQTELKNKIRAQLAQQAEDVRREIERREEGLFTGKGLEFLDRLILPDTEGMILKDLILSFREGQAHLQKSDDLVDRLYEKLEEARRIDTVPGFAKTLSVLMAVEMEDINRFESVSNLHAYAGLVPTTHASGERVYHGPITKEGNKWVRWAALEAVYPATRKDLDLKALYSRLAKRKGPNVAKIAVARRLLTIIYRVLKEKREYIPDRKQISAA
jgi:transposase